MIKPTQQHEGTARQKGNNQTARNNGSAIINRIGGFYEERENRRVEQLNRNRSTKKTRLENQGIHRSVTGKSGVPNVSRQTKTVGLKNGIAIPESTPHVPESKPHQQPMRRRNAVKQSPRIENEVRRHPNERTLTQQINKRGTYKTTVAQQQQRKRPRRIDWSGPAIMVYFSFLMGATSVLLHGLDLLVAWPFHQASIMYDVVFLICGAILAGMSWHTCKEREKYRKF